MEQHDSTIENLIEITKATDLDNSTISLYRYALSPNAVPSSNVPFSFVMVLNQDQKHMTNILAYVFDKVWINYLDPLLKKDVKELNEENLNKLVEVLNNCIYEVKNSIVIKTFEFNLSMLKKCFFYKFYLSYKADTYEKDREKRTNSYVDLEILTNQILPKLSSILFDRIIEKDGVLLILNKDDPEMLSNVKTSTHIWSELKSFEYDLDEQRKENLKELETINHSLRSLEKVVPIDPKSKSEDGSIIKADLELITVNTDYNETYQEKLRQSYKTSRKRLNIKEDFLKEFEENKTKRSSMNNLTKNEKKTVKEMRSHENTLDQKEEESWMELEEDDSDIKSELIRNLRDLKIIFDNCIATEFIPRISYYYNQETDEGEKCLAIHKLYNSKEMTQFMSFKDEKEKPNTIRFRVLTSKGKPTKSVKHSKTQRYSKMEEDSRIIGSKINKDMFTDVTISLKFSSIRYFCPHKGDAKLVNRRIVEAFRCIRLKNFVQTRICYSLLYPISENQGFDDTSFTYATMMDPVMSIYFCPDETKGKLSSRKRISYRCRGFFSGIQDEKEGREITVSSSSYILSFRPTLVIVGTNSKEGKVQRRLKIKISKAVSKEAINVFTRYCRYILSYYFSKLEYFRRLSFYSPDVSSSTIKINSRENPELAILKEGLGKAVIASNYGTWCQREKQPTIIPEEDVHLYADRKSKYMIKDNLSGEMKEMEHSSAARSFEGENGTVWLISTNPLYPFVVFQKNTISNSDLYPLLPKCSDYPFEKEARQRDFLAGHNPTHIIKNHLAVRQNNFGTISPFISSLLSVFEHGYYFRRGVNRDSTVQHRDEDDENPIYEQVVHKSSLIHAVIEGLKVFVDNNNNYFEHSLSQHGYKACVDFFSENKSDKPKAEIIKHQKKVVQKLRQKILKVDDYGNSICNIELCSQSISNFNVNKSRASNEVFESEELFDGVKYLRLLEYFFNIDIYVFGKKNKGEKPTFILPFNQSNQIYCRSPRKPKPCVLIYCVKVFNDTFSQETSYAQYETIVLSKVEKPTKRSKDDSFIKKCFSKDMSSYLNDILEKSISTLCIFKDITASSISSFCLFEEQPIFNNTLGIIGLDKKFLKPNRQLLDSYGKSQLFTCTIYDTTKSSANFTKSKSCSITLCTVPIESINCPSLEETEIDAECVCIEIEKAISFFGMPNNISKKENKIVGLWYKFGNVDKNRIYILCKEDNYEINLLKKVSKIAVQEPHPLSNIVNLDNSEVLKLSNMKDKSFSSFETGYCLSQVCRWLLAIYYKEFSPKKFNTNAHKKMLSKYIFVSDKVDDKEFKFTYSPFFPKDVNMEKAVEFVRNSLTYNSSFYLSDEYIINQGVIFLSPEMNKRWIYQLSKMNMMSHSFDFYIPQEIIFDFPRTKTNQMNNNLQYCSTQNLNSHIQKIVGEEMQINENFKVSDESRKNLFIYKSTISTINGNESIFYLCINIHFTSLVEMSVDQDNELEDYKASHLLSIASIWINEKRIAEVPSKIGAANGNLFPKTKSEYDESLPIVVYGISSYSKLFPVYCSKDMTRHDPKMPIYEIVSYSSEKSSTSFCILLRL